MCFFAPSLPHVTYFRHPSYIYTSGGHCKKLAPVWDELADKVEAESPEDGILLAKVDCTKEKAVCGRFKVRGYPTLLYFAERSMFRYSGARDIDSLAAFATGGYKESKGEDVPAETLIPTALYRQADALKDPELQ